MPRLRPSRPSIAASAAVAALALAACGDGPGGGPAPAPSDGGAPSDVPVVRSGLPCDVDAILTRACNDCHAASPLFGAPMPLVTWEDLHAPSPGDPSKKAYELSLERAESETAPMPPPPSARLSAADLKVLADWAAAGAPRSADACGGPGPKSSPGLSCTPDVTLAPSEPWEMPADAGDAYVCWGVDLSRAEPTHITGLAPKIDNATIVHHVLLYEADASYPSTPQPCNAGGAIAWRVVYGWAPGGQAIELPDEAGFPIATGGAKTHYVVQMHYSNAQKLAGQRDASALELCTSPPRKYEADVLAFGTQDIRIPAQPPAGGVFERACSVTVPPELAGLRMFAALPHMHKLGVSMSTTLKRKAGGAAVDLGTMSAFSFDTQAWLPIDATTKAGDVITTTCGWKNTTGAEVGFGERTADEMCYSFTMYYPRVGSVPGLPAGAWSWAGPALTSTCE